MKSPHLFRNSRQPALGAAALLAPPLHGLAGAWDELVLMGVAFALFGGYVLWLRGAFGRRGQDDAPKDDDNSDGESGQAQ